MSRSLLIVGAGGHGCVVADAARLTGLWERIAFIDDRYPEIDCSADWPVIGRVVELDSLAATWSEVVVAVGENAARLDILQRARRCGLNATTVIHPSAQIAENVTIGDGSVIFANAVINIGSVIGDSCIVNTAATVDHDNCLGEGVHISPGVHLGGDVEIGARSWIGIGASVMHGRVIGADVIVGAGAVVIKDVDDALTVVGVPAKEHVI